MTPTEEAKEALVALAKEALESAPMVLPRSDLDSLRDQLEAVIRARFEGDAEKTARLEADLRAVAANLRAATETRLASRMQDLLDRVLQLAMKLADALL